MGKPEMTMKGMREKRTLKKNGKKKNQTRDEGDKRGACPRWRNN